MITILSHEYLRPGYKMVKLTPFYFLLHLVVPALACTIIPSAPIVEDRIQLGIPKKILWKQMKLRILLHKEKSFPELSSDAIVPMLKPGTADTKDNQSHPWRFQLRHTDSYFRLHFFLCLRNILGVLYKSCAQLYWFVACRSKLHLEITPWSSSLVKAPIERTPQIQKGWLSSTAKGSLLRIQTLPHSALWRPGLSCSFPN